jgi:hypothetical protein
MGHGHFRFFHNPPPKEPTGNNFAGIEESFFSFDRLSGVLKKFPLIPPSPRRREKLHRSIKSLPHVVQGDGKIDDAKILGFRKETRNILDTIFKYKRNFPREKLMPVLTPAKEQ